MSKKVMSLGEHEQSQAVASAIGFKAAPGRLQLNIHPEMLAAINLECEASRNGGQKLKITDIALEFWAEWLKERGVDVPDNWKEKPSEWKTINPAFMVKQKK